MTRSQLAQLKKLLLSRDAEQILQGVELAASLDDPAVWDVLLDGVEWHLDGIRPGLGAGNYPVRTIGVLHPGKIFQKNGNSRLWDEMTTALLLARSPHPLRKEMTHLSLCATRRGRFTHEAIDLRLPEFNAFPKLRAVELHLDREMTALEPSRLRTVTTLSVHAARHTEFEFPALPDVEHLHFRVQGYLDKATLSLGDMPKLRELDVDVAIPSLDRPLPNLQRLRAWSLSEPHLSKKAPALKTLSCDTLHQAIVDVTTAHFESYDDRSVRPLTVHCSELGKIGNLKDLAALNVETPGAGPVSVAPLLAVKDLQTVSLRGAQPTDLEVLNEHPSLCVVLVDGETVDKKSLPPLLRRMTSVAKNPDWKTMRQKERPTLAPRRRSVATNELTTGQRKAFSRIKALLTKPDIESIMQGVELAAGLADPSVIEVLLEGVTVDDGLLIPNKLFSAGRFRQPWLDLALLHLVARVDHDLRNQVSVAVLGYEAAKPKMMSLPLAGLGGLLKLRELSVHVNEGAEVDLNTLNAVPSLTDLRVVLHRELTAFEIELPSFSSVERITGQWLTLPEDGHWPQLKELTITNQNQTTLSSLMTPKLRNVSVNGELTLLDFAALGHVHAGLRPARKQPFQFRSDPISTLHLSNCSEISTLSLGHTTLSIGGTINSIGRVNLRGGMGKDYSCLGQVQCIDTFNFHHAGSLRGLALPEGTKAADGFVRLGHMSANLAILKSLVGVQALALPAMSTAVSLEPLRQLTELRFLDLRENTGVVDLSPLLDLPELCLIAIRGTRLLDIPQALHGVIDVSGAPNFDLSREEGKRRRSRSALPDDFWDAQLQCALRSGDKDRIDRAIEAAGANAPEAIDAALRSFKQRNGALAVRQPYGPISNGDRVVALASLLRHVSDDSAAAAKWQSVAHLNLGEPRAAVAVDFLDVFPALRSLDLQYSKVDLTPATDASLDRLNLLSPDQIVGGESLAQMQIHELRIISASEVLDLSVLIDHPTLAVLKLWDRKDWQVPDGLPVTPQFRK